MWLTLGDGARTIHRAFQQIWAFSAAIRGRQSDCESALALVESLSRCDRVADVLTGLSAEISRSGVGSVDVVAGAEFEPGLRGTPTDPGRCMPLLLDGRHVATVVVHGRLCAGGDRVLRWQVHAAQLALDLLALRDHDAAQAVVAERARVARDIHDGVAQHLAFMKMRVAWLKREPQRASAAALDDLEGQLGLTLSEARAAITTLRARPSAGFTEAIETYVHEFGEVAGLQVEVRAQQRELNVSPRAKAEVLRVVQEALNNVRKHARASRVEVEVRDRRDGVEVRVEDNGIGLADGGGAIGHFGTEIMRERAESVGGTLQLARSERGGTLVQVWIPAAVVTRGQASPRRV